MKILFAASEAAPFAKTGGLADVVGSLPPALAALGHDVRVVIPRYRSVDPGKFNLKHVTTFFVPLASWKERCDVLTGSMEKHVTVYFINKDIYFDRPELYRTARADYRDNAERFTFFSRAVVELCLALDFSPDIVHCNDWQTGLVPFYLRMLPLEGTPLARTKSVFTVHNLGYQGVFWHWDMRIIGLGWDAFTPEGLEFWGKINFLKAGLVYSDIITTVSKTYSREIQTPDYGHGLDGVLAKRAADLYGIVNGIDYAKWDPERDTSIAQKFSVARPAGKAACKENLLKLISLSPSSAPVIGMVTRLAEQKGLDILADAIPEIMAMGMRLIILGTGEEKYHSILTDAAQSYLDQMRLILRYDDALAKSIYAGCDMFLMPSRYEPCGLGQMIALRYGTVPVVRRTGGLTDTVMDYHEKTYRGTGFVFNDYSAGALASCLRRAYDIYRDPRKWKRLIRACMRQDFSWERSAKEYAKLYRQTMKKR
jgi:starch synthase